MTLNDLVSGYTASGGQLSGDDLQEAGRTAWRHLYSRTFGRVYSTDSNMELVQNCFNDLVDCIWQRRDGGLIASQSVGNWSQTFVDGNGGQTTDQICAAIIRQWLGETGLLYRGWDPCE